MNKLSVRTIASRRNGKKSKGPVTPQGKSRSSANPIRHGLLARCVVIKGEDKTNFEALRTQHIAKVRPADDIEFSAVEEMAAATWRIRRIWSIESHLYNQITANRPEDTYAARIAGAFAQLSESKEIHLLDRYEARLTRTYRTSLQNIALLRQLKPAEPALLHMKNEPHGVDPVRTRRVPPESRRTNRVKRASGGQFPKRTFAGPCAPRSTEQPSPEASYPVLPNEPRFPEAQPNE